MRVRIINTPYGQGFFVSTDHPTEHRVIVLGDEFEVDKITSGGTAFYRTYKSYEGELLKRWFEIVDGGSTSTTAKACDCPMNVLMAHGCQCGGK